MRYLHAEELQIASRFLFLSMAITVIEQDINHIETGHFKIKEPYLDLLQKMTSEAKDERRQLRKQMYDRNLKVTRLQKRDLFTSFLFTCQGREEERTYFNPAIRNKVKNIIFELVEKVDRQHDPLYADGAPDASANN